MTASKNTVEAPLPRPTIASWWRRIQARFGWALLVLAAFFAIHLHTIVLDETLEPPPSAVFGNLSGTETRLLDREPRREVRLRSFYYTADPTGSSALYPVDHFILDNWRHGQFSLWNPFVLTGLSLIADGYWQLFYPPNAMLLVLGEAWWTIYSYVHLLLAALFLAWLYYTLRPRRFEAALAAIASFGVGWLLFYLPMLMFVSVIPWGISLLLASELLFKNPRGSRGIGLAGLACAGLGAAGHAAIAIFWSVAAAIYVTALILTRKDGYKILPGLVIGGVLGALISAPSWLNFAEAILHNDVRQFAPWRTDFFSLTHLITFAFPYWLGEVNVPGPPAILAPTTVAGFFWLPPFGLAVACLGIWRALRTRNILLFPIGATGLLTALWGFGVPPLSYLADVSALARLNYFYIWPIPGLCLCVFFAYGMGSLISHPGSPINRSVYVISSAYVLASILAVVIIIGTVGWSDYHGMMSILLTAITFGAIGPLLVLDIAKRRLPGQPGTVQVLALGLFILCCNLIAVYPSADVSHVLFVAGITFAIVMIYFNALRYGWWRFGNRAGVHLPLVLVTIGLITVIANWIGPALPRRHGIDEKPPFLDAIGDTANWRVYGLGDVGAVNNFTINHISGMNNQNATVPETFRLFLRHYVDSFQAPQLFLGIQQDYIAASKSSPIDQLQRHRRMWDYLGVRFLLTSLYTVPERSAAERELFGYRLVETPGVYKELPQAVDGVSVPLDCSAGPVVAVRTRLATFSREPAGALRLRILNDDNEIFRTEAATKYISSGQYVVLPAGDATCQKPGDKIVLNFRYIGAAPGDRLGVWYGSDDRVAVDPIFSTEEQSHMKLRQVIPRLGILVFENLTAQPRSYFAPRYETVADWRSAQSAFGSLSDPRSVAYGEARFPACPLASPSTPADPTETNIVEIEANSVRLEANVGSPGVLVLTDTYAPGWSATVNDRPAPVLRINGVFRGVCIPAAGKYRVTMTYQPPFWRLSLALAAAGLLGWAGFVARWVAVVRFRRGASANA